jgi:hypothetical protein
LIRQKKGVEQAAQDDASAIEADFDDSSDT